MVQALAGSVEVWPSYRPKTAENQQKNMIFGALLSDGQAVLNMDPMTPGGTFTGQTESGRQIRQSGRLEKRPLFLRV